jgi:hypothetical protein
MSAYRHSVTAWIGPDDFEVELEVSYGVDPGYRGSFIEPPEGPSVDVRRVRLLGPDGKRLECPEWLYAALMPSEDDLLEAAGEARAAEADERADYDRDARWMEAAE